MRATTKYLYLLELWDNSGGVRRPYAASKIARPFFFSCLRGGGHSASQRKTSSARWLNCRYASQRLHTDAVCVTSTNKKCCLAMIIPMYKGSAPRRRYVRARKNTTKCERGRNLSPITGAISDCSAKSYVCRTDGPVLCYELVGGATS